jgi:hypothetical protein
MADLNFSSVLNNTLQVHPGCQDSHDADQTQEMAVAAQGSTTSQGGSFTSKIILW